MQQLLIKSLDTRGQDKMKPSTTILRNWFARGVHPPPFAEQLPWGKSHRIGRRSYVRPEKRGIINPLHLFPFLLGSLTLGPGHIQYNRRQFSFISDDDVATTLLGRTKLCVKLYAVCKVIFCVQLENFTLG